MVYIKKFKRNRPQKSKPTLSDVMTKVPGLSSNIQRHLGNRDVRRLAQVNRFSRDHARPPPPGYSNLERAIRKPNIRRNLLRYIAGDGGYDMMLQPEHLIDLEHFRAASKTTRRLTQRDVMRGQLDHMASLVRERHAGQESPFENIDYPLGRSLRDKFRDMFSHPTRGHATYMIHNRIRNDDDTLVGYPPEPASPPFQ